MQWQDAEHHRMKVSSEFPRGMSRVSLVAYLTNLIIPHASERVTCYLQVRKR